MKNITIFPAGTAESCCWASFFLHRAHFTITDHICPEITHLLLDIPSFDDNGNLKDGTDLQELLNRLPENITVIGGQLNHQYLAQYSKIDLLNDATYLAKNAAITAECALQVAANYLNTTFADSRILILGWGRIGKCLSQLLKANGCNVTVAARNIADRAILNALGYNTLDYSDIPAAPSTYDILFNTVPQQRIDSGILNLWKGCIKLDLASVPGIACDNVIYARGLPGKYAPKSSGKLIAESVQSALKEVSL